MSGASSLDIRLPIGGLFTVLGIILGGYGLATIDDPALYARSFSLNVNLWWGIVMLAFGLGLLLSATFYSRSGRRRTVRPAEESLEGRSTEAREGERGLER